MGFEFMFKIVTNINNFIFGLLLLFKTNGYKVIRIDIDISKEKHG